MRIRFKVACAPALALLSGAALANPQPGAVMATWNTSTTGAFGTGPIESFSTSPNQPMLVAGQQYWLGVFNDGVAVDAWDESTTQVGNNYNAGLGGYNGVQAEGAMVLTVTGGLTTYDSLTGGYNSGLGWTVGPGFGHEFHPIFEFTAGVSGDLTNIELSVGHDSGSDDFTVTLYSNTPASSAPGPAAVVPFALGVFGALRRRR